MRAGALRHQAQLQTVTTTPDGRGGVTETWTTTASVPASVEPMQGDERMKAQQVDATLTHTVRLRYRSGVTARMRVLVGSRVLDVRAVVNPGERNRELQLLCAEVV